MLHVEYVQDELTKRWSWVIMLGKDGFGKSLRDYARKADAERAFQKLDRLF